MSTALYNDFSYTFTICNIPTTEREFLDESRRRLNGKEYYAELNYTMQQLVDLINLYRARIEEIQKSVDSLDYPQPHKDNYENIYDTIIYNCEKNIKDELKCIISVYEDLIEVIKGVLHDKIDALV